MGWLVFDRLADANDFNDVLGAHLGYPSGNTLRYTDPIVHPLNSKAALLIQDRVLPFLPPNTLLVSYSDMQLAGWFPA